MKKQLIECGLLILVFVALLLVTPAKAGTWAVARNDAGGAIGLTDEDCPLGNKVGKLMFATNKSGKSIYGCWTSAVGDDFVYVRYEDGSFYTYPLRGFVLTDYAKRKDESSL